MLIRTDSLTFFHGPIFFNINKYNIKITHLKVMTSLNNGNGFLPNHYGYNRLTTYLNLNTSKGHIKHSLSSGTLHPSTLLYLWHTTISIGILCRNILSYTDSSSSGQMGPSPCLLYEHSGSPVNFKESNGHGAESEETKCQRYRKTRQPHESTNSV